MKNQVENYLQKIQLEEAKGETNSEALKRWKQKHFNETLKHEAIIERLEKEYPEYYQLKYKLPSISLQDLQSSLFHEDGMGTTALAVNYTTMILTSLFLAPSIVKVLGMLMIDS